MSVTIKDVAKLAGVSPSTVSRVISDNPKISEETKARVTTVIHELNYHPNVIARSLANSSTKMLGLILPNNEEDLFKNPFFIQIMTGISVYAQKKGYYIMYTFSNDEKEELNFIKNYTNSKMADGIILLTSRPNDKCINYLKKYDYPFVVVGRPENVDKTLWVDNDNFKAMYNVVINLISKGHKSIGFIGGPKDLNMSRDRLMGYLKALEENGLEADLKLVSEERDFSENSGFRAIKKIYKTKTPTAIVTTDDLLAFGAIKYLTEYNLEKISIVGFNNTPLSIYQNPPLSSVDINAEKLGYYATKLLIEKLNGEEMTTTHFIIDANLIERESSK
jgi:DNA-binding LacI/PurR family transcriptional regulator